MDGKLDDSVWQNIPEAGGFVILGTETLTKKQTFFKIGYNAEAIYVGIKCEEPEVNKIESKFKDEDGKICEDNSIEIFFFPAYAKTYFQFIVNSGGFRWNGIGLGKAYPLGNWQAKVYKGKDFYSVEMKIPFEILLPVDVVVPEKNEEWKMNIARNSVVSEDRHTCWPFLKTGFHDIDRFGKLIFPEEISGEKTIPYFKEKIANNLNVLHNFKKDFSEKEEAPLLQRKIELFLKDYEKIERTSESELKNLSVKEINLLLKESGALIAKGEELKKEIILKDLFD